jgi:hypothetical protein
MEDITMSVTMQMVNDTRARADRLLAESLREAIANASRALAAVEAGESDEVVRESLMDATQQVRDAHSYLAYRRYAADHTGLQTGRSAR